MYAIRSYYALSSDTTRATSPLASASAAAAPRERLDLAARLAALRPHHSGECPACGRPLGEAVYRSERKTYLRCPDCGLVRMTHFFPRENPYAERAYFFDEYKAQYGRTYVDDIPSIRKASAKRLAVIESMLPAGHEGQGRNNFV